MATTTEGRGPARGEPRSFAPRRLLRGERPHGDVVFDRAGGRVGVIEEVAIDEATGEPAYAILHHGGFFGLGRRRRPLPWSLLAYDARKGGYVACLDRAAIDRGPAFDAEALEARDDGAYRETIHAYYARHGAAPY